MNETIGNFKKFTIEITEDKPYKLFLTLTPKHEREFSSEVIKEIKEDLKDLGKWRQYKELRQELNEKNQN